MRLDLAIVLALTLSTPALAQAPPPADVAAQKAAMAKLDFLLGEWKGEGWIAHGPNRETFSSWEKITPKVDGLAFLVEGLHKDGAGKAVHDALAVISWDEAAGHYRFSSYLANGRSGESSGKLEDDAFVWSPAPQVRYTLRLDAEGRWHEIGEHSPDGGKTWNPFFEMRLERVGD